MGMTDRQFDSHQAGVLRELERIEEEINEIAEGKIKKSETLEKLKKDIKNHLTRA